MAVCIPGCCPGRILPLFGLPCCIAEILALHHRATDIHGSNATITDTQINTGLFSMTAVLSKSVRIAQFWPSFLVNLKRELISFHVSSSFSVSLCFSLDVFHCRSSFLEFLSHFPSVSFCLLSIKCCHFDFDRRVCYLWSDIGGLKFDFFLFSMSSVINSNHTA